MDNTPSSEELMARVVEGDNQAFEILINPHQISVPVRAWHVVNAQVKYKKERHEITVVAEINRSCCVVS